MQVNKLFDILKDAYNYHPIVRLRSELVQTREYYPYIPTNGYIIQDIVDDLTASKVDLSKKSFIDIGCGIPIIPKIFQLLGCPKSDGLEYNTIYKNFFYDLIIGDLLTYKFKAYDVLYAYNPIADRKLMEQGLINITTSMKRGATFYFHSSGISDSFLNKLGFTIVGKTRYCLYKFKKK